MADLLNELRKAIREGDELPSAVAARAGVHKSVVSRLLAGLTVTVEVAERLADAMGYKVELRPATRRRKEK